jgi:hypothetical protein
VITDAAAPPVPNENEHSEVQVIAQAQREPTGQVAERTDQEDQAGKDVQLADAGGCGDGPCSKEPPTPGNLAAVPGWPHGEWPFDEFGDPNEHYDRLTPDQKMDLVQRDIGLSDRLIPGLENTPDRLGEGFVRRLLDQARERLDREVAPHVTPDTPEGRRLTEQRNKLREQLGRLDNLRNPTSVVQVDPSGTHAQAQRPVVESPTLGHGHVAGRPVDPSLPGTSVTDLETNPPPVSATDLSANSAPRRPTLTEKAAFALGVDPSTIDDSITNSAALLGMAGVLWVFSSLSPQVRLALLQGTGKGGLKGVPFMTTSRPVDG